MKTIEEILSYLDDEQIAYRFIGNIETQVKGFSSLSQYKTGNLTWIKSEKNIPAGYKPDSVTLAVIQDDVNASAQNTIMTPESKRVFFSIIEHLFCPQNDRKPVGYGTYIGPNVKLGHNVRIGHNCSLDGDISIGDDTEIWDNVSMRNKISIGSNCIIHSGTIIGYDGYAYTEDKNHVKTMIKHYGGITIGNHVFIGPNCVIYRGSIDDTIIGTGCKIGSLCNIGNNVLLEENVSVIAGTILHGSVKVRRNSYISTSVTKNQVLIGENAFVGMGSVVIKDVPPDTTVAGVPAKPVIKENK